MRETTPHNAGVTGTTRDGVWWIDTRGRLQRMGLDDGARAAIDGLNAKKLLGLP